MLGGWFPRTGPHMQTDQPGVFSAGDCAGVAGALVAVEQGALAGLYAAQRVGAMTTWQAGRSAAPSSRRLRSLRRFRRAMDRMYPIHPNLYANMTDQTTVCRCEQVTAGSIRKAVRAGTADLNDIKKRTRAGMGYCQGANCVPPMAAMLHREFNVEEDAVDTMTSRPPAEPVPLRLLVTADGAMNRFGIESDPSHASTDWM